MKSESIQKPKKVSSKKNLTKQQSMFVENMANPEIKSQTEAAVKAGCPPKNARITASKWLTKSNILEAVEERKARAISNSGITPEEVLGSAVFNMRVSIDDLLDEDGSLNLEKARQTGAIDLVKKIRASKEVNAKTGNVKTITEIEIYSAADARKEVASYIGFEKIRNVTNKELSEIEFARRLFTALVEKRKWTVEKALEGINHEFPNLDLKQVFADLL